LNIPLIRNRKHELLRPNQVFFEKLRWVLRIEGGQAKKFIYRKKGKAQTDRKKLGRKNTTNGVRKRRKI